MNSKLVASIAIAMMAVISLSMFTVLPAHAQPNIFMVPNTVNGATVGLGNTIDVTVWVSGWGAPPVFAFQIFFVITNPAAGIIITKAVLPAASDPQYILTGHATARPTPSVTPTSAKVGDTSLDTSAVPGPEPAKLAIITLQVVGAPGKFQTLSSELNINNGDTYLLDDALSTIPITATDGTYSWAWVAPTTNPNVAVRFIGGTPITAQHIKFDQFGSWNGTTFVAQVWIENLDLGWAISGAAFTLSYTNVKASLVSAALDPAWTGTVDTSVPGVITVSATTTTSMTGDVLVLGATFQIHDQYSSPPEPTGTFWTETYTLTGITLMDTVGPIPVAAVLNGQVDIYAKQALTSPWLTVTPTPIISGTDLVIGNQFGKTFTVNVVVNQLDSHWNLVAVQFRLQYDSNFVQFVSASEGPFLQAFAPDGTFFVAQNTLGDVLYGDNVAVGDMIMPNAGGEWLGPFPSGTGVVASLTFAYVKQDFVNTYNVPLTLADFGLPPAPQVYFVDNLGATIPYDAAQQTGGMVIIQPISTIGRRIDVWMQYPAPFGGQGLNQPADLVVPQQLIILTAKVTYNWWPVVNKKVTFNIYDEQGNLVAVLEAITGADGHAVTSYRMPWPDVNPENLFGVWTVVASVSVADVTVTDTLMFHYDYLVEILNAVVDKVNYNHLDFMAVTVTYGSHAQQMYPVFLTATLQDNLLVPVSTAFTGLSVSGATFCTLKVYPTASLTLYVPYYAYAGAAQVRVDFLDKSPMDGTHTAVTPEFTITGLYILPV